MSEQWHYSRQGEKFGPVGASKLKQLSRDGDLHPDDLVWRAGLPDWMPARKIKGLFPEAIASSESIASPPPLPPTLQQESDQPTGWESLIPDMHRQKLALLCAAGVGVLATFLPWVHVPIIGSISGSSGAGWVTLALFIPAIVLCLIGVKDVPLIAGQRLGATIPAGIAGLIALSKIFSLNSTLIDNPYAASIQIGIGVYLVIVAAIGIIVVAWVLEKTSKK